MQGKLVEPWQNFRLPLQLRGVVQNLLLHFMERRSLYLYVKDTLWSEVSGTGVGMAVFSHYDWECYHDNNRERNIN